MVTIRKYCRADGVIPFDRWMGQLRDLRAKARVLIQLDRLILGLPGDWKPVGGGGVFELRIRQGKGYRVYFAWEERAVVLLLCGGNKAAQRRDIETAKSYWREYRRQK